MPAAVRNTPVKPARGGARIALLNAAHKLVRQKGWTATSVDDLCADAGGTKGAFFHPFASKDELGVAAAEHWTEVTGPLFANASYHKRRDPLEILPRFRPQHAEDLIPLAEQQIGQIKTVLAGNAGN